MGFIKIIGIWLLTTALLLCAAFFVPSLSTIAILAIILCLAGFPVVFSLGLTRVKGLANSKYLFPLQVAVIVFWGFGSNFAILGISTNNLFGLMLYIVTLCFAVKKINLSIKVRDSRPAERL